MNVKKQLFPHAVLQHKRYLCVCVCISVFVMEDLIKIPIERQDFGKLLQKIGFTKLTAKCGDIWL